MGRDRACPDAAENVTSLVPLTRFAKTDLYESKYRTYPHATGRQCPLSKMDSYLVSRLGVTRPKETPASATLS